MTRPVTLRGARQRLLLGLPERGMPLVLSWAEDAGGDTGEAAARLKAPSRRVNGMDEAVPDAVLLPTGALGSFGWPALQGHRDGRDWILLFGPWRAETAARSLVLQAEDAVARIGIEIRLGVSTAEVFTMQVVLSNRGESAYQLDRCMAGTILVEAGVDRLLAYEGGWGREFQLAEQRLGAGIWLQENRRGRTSHDRSPTLVLTGEPRPFGAPAGSIGLHLGWSGNHVIAVERLEDGRRLVHAGELFEPGEMRLVPGQSYTSPVAHFMQAFGGLDGIASAFRAHVRHHVLAWPGGRMRPRPVTLNTWEGNYFAHDLAGLKDQATAAAALGIERFVLDDGWFGRRDDDTTSLGDWQVDARKYPDGLGPLVDHVTGLGLQFGLWFEPEMVNPDSDLYRAHPDWALQVAGRPRPLSRHQLVLDLSRPEVSEHIFAQLDAVLSAHAISYIKWDMNRDLTAAGGADGRAATSRQTCAVYALMDRVRRKHPDVEIESCASGGGRVDYGVLRFTQRIWLSDCTDALDRLAIQNGAALFVPPEITGSHVSASPNHQTGRRLSLAFRAIVAIDGHFGVELDPRGLTPQEARELAGWIGLHKRLRPILHGAASRLFRRDVTDGRHVHGAIAADRIIVIVAQTGQMLRYQPDNIRVPGADASRAWRVAACHPPKPDFIRVTPEQQAMLDGAFGFSAADLAAIGLPVPVLYPEAAVILELDPEDLPHG